MNELPECLNKFYNRARVEVHKDRTKFRVALLQKKNKELKLFQQKHRLINVRFLVLGRNHLFLY